MIVPCLPYQELVVVFLNFNFSSLGHEYEFLLRQKLDEAGLAYLGEDCQWLIELQLWVFPSRCVISATMTTLATKQLQIDIDLLLIITSTGDELFSGTNIGDLERL